MNVTFNSLEELYKRVKPALIAKKEQMHREGYVYIKIAFKKEGIFHDKCGIVTDEKGNVICFRGSNNETEAAIMESISNLKGKKTMIIIAHRLSTIADCDVIYQVKDGIIEQTSL